MASSYEISFLRIETRYKMAIARTIGFTSRRHADGNLGWRDPGWRVAYNNSIVAHLFDLRSFAREVVARHPNAYLEYVSGHGDAEEIQHGQWNNGVYVPNIPLQGWSGDVAAYNYKLFWNASANGSMGNIDCDSRKHTWKPWSAGNLSAPIRMSDLQSHPFFVIIEFKYRSTTHYVNLGTFQIESFNIYEMVPGFPGWAGNVMSQNGKAVPGWASQLVSGNWLTSFVGGKRYLNAI